MSSGEQLFTTIFVLKVFQEKAVIKGFSMTHLKTISVVYDGAKEISVGQVLRFEKELTVRNDGVVVAKNGDFQISKYPLIEFSNGNVIFPALVCISSATVAFSNFFGFIDISKYPMKEVNNNTYSAKITIEEIDNGKHLFYAIEPLKIKSVDARIKKDLFEAMQNSQENVDEFVLTSMSVGSSNESICNIEGIQSYQNLFVAKSDMEKKILALEENIQSLLIGAQDMEVKNCELEEKQEDLMKQLKDMEQKMLGLEKDNKKLSNDLREGTLILLRMNSDLKFSRKITDSLELQQDNNAFVLRMINEHATLLTDERVQQIVFNRNNNNSTIRETLDPILQEIFSRVRSLFSCFHTANRNHNSGRS